MAKLLDFAGRADVLERSPNPFARFVLAHLKTMETRRSMEDRLAWKSRIVKGLYDGGMAADDVRRLYRFLDAMMDVGPANQAVFWDDFVQFERERAMPFVTPTETMLLARGIEQGIERGRRESVLHNLRRLLTNRFGPDGAATIDGRREVGSADDLQRVLDAAIDGASLDELRAVWVAAP